METASTAAKLRKLLVKYWINPVGTIKKCAEDFINTVTETLEVLLQRHLPDSEKDKNANANDQHNPQKHSQTAGRGCWELTKTAIIYDRVVWASILLNPTNRLLRLEYTQYLQQREEYIAPSRIYTENVEQGKSCLYTQSRKTFDAETKTCRPITLSLFIPKSME